MHLFYQQKYISFLQITLINCIQLISTQKTVFFLSKDTIRYSGIIIVSFSILYEKNLFIENLSFLKNWIY